jgi:hypothetical protein
MYELSLNPTIRFALIFAAEYITLDNLQEVEKKETFPLRAVMSSAHRMYSDELSQMIDDDIEIISNRLDDLIDQGSGWVLNDGIYIDIEIAHTAPLGGAGAGMWKTQFVLKNKNHIHSLSTSDGKCFLYALAVGFIGEENAYTNDLDMYKSFAEKHFNISGLKFPLRLTDVIRFELKNVHLKTRINVLFAAEGASGYAIYPAHFSKSCPVDCVKVINLLLTLGRTAEENHYHLILNVNKFIRKNYKTDKVSSSYQNIHFCINCFARFSTSDLLDKHAERCKQFREQIVEISTDPLEFSEYSKMGKMQVIGFFDFESRNIQNKCAKCDAIKCTCNMKTKTICMQEPICYSLLILDYIKKEVLVKKTYTGDDAVVNMLKTLMFYEEKLKAYIEKNEAMTLSMEEEQQFAKAIECYLCKKPFKASDHKVRDHLHATGAYIGAAHNSCNLQRRRQYTIPLYCHNFIGYDSHPVIKALSEISFTTMKILPKNMEKIMNIRINSYVLNDTLSFLNAPLDTLVENLKHDGHSFEYLKMHPQIRKCVDEKKKTYLLNLMMRKGVFPYDFVRSIPQMYAQKSIPEKSDFYNVLTESEVNDASYEHALTVFKAFSPMDNMVDYMEFYCLLDVILLCEVFNKFRDVTINDFGLDPAHYVSLPSLAFSAMLLKTEIKIEAAPDPEMYLMIKRGVRGGHSYISERIVKVDEHPDVDPAEDFIKSETESDLLYIDW